MESTAPGVTQDLVEPAVVPPRPGTVHAAVAPLPRALTGEVADPVVPETVPRVTMPRKRGRPRDPEADGRILKAAAHLILMRGFDNMTVDEVATRARVGKATVYRRWAKKEDLALAAMQQLYTAQIPLPDTGSLRGDLRACYASLVVFGNSEQGKAYLRMAIGESMRDPRVTAMYRSAVESVEASSRDMFKRAVARGEIRKGPKIDFAIQWLVGIFTMRTVVGQRPLPLSEVDAMVDFTLHGLGAR